MEWGMLPVNFGILCGFRSVFIVSCQIVLTRQNVSEKAYFKWNLRDKCRVFFFLYFPEDKYLKWP